ncbi:MAG: hypothetical protein GY822_21560 [Deltaproteobacteria bacterium]|nr:hypothetical protein [Deltaproteobacteria bacterium]
MSSFAVVVAVSKIVPFGSAHASATDVIDANEAARAEALFRRRLARAFYAMYTPGMVFAL